MREFFYANRCIIPYLNEGIRMSVRASPPALRRKRGPAGRNAPGAAPARRRDLDRPRGCAIAKATKAAMGAEYPDEAVDEVLFRLRRRRPARAEGEGGGYYAYDEAGSATGLWEGARWRGTPSPKSNPNSPRSSTGFSSRRCSRAVRALEEGVLTDIREGDVGAILGWGFAPWSGGPFSWLRHDRGGTGRALRRGARGEAMEHEKFKNFLIFAAPELLREMAASGETFYSRFRCGKPRRPRPHRRASGPAGGGAAFERTRADVPSSGHRSNLACRPAPRRSLPRRSASSDDLDEVDGHHPARSRECR